MKANNFLRMKLENWRQFKRIDLEFSPGVTILTGQNGTGKSTILKILAEHSGYKQSLIGEPVQKRDEAGRFVSGYWYVDDLREDQHRIGYLYYGDNSAADIVVPKFVANDFQVSIKPQQPVPCLNISSHRRVPFYAPVQTIPTNPISSTKALKNYQSEFWNNASRVQPLAKMKEAIISMAAFGIGNDRLRPNPESLRALQNFEQRLIEIIPKSIGFRRLSVSMPDVILETDAGHFLIDASSGGLMSLIDLTWELTLFGLQHSSFSVLFDEPENHLHPSMQRDLLPSLVRAFPEVQFVVATHSPFVVSSVKNASIYAFDVAASDLPSRQAIGDYSSMRNAVSSFPVNFDRSAEASEVLDKVLGLKVTAPSWVETELDELLKPLRDGVTTKEEIYRVQELLKNRGLDRYFPELIYKAFSDNAKD